MGKEVMEQGIWVFFQGHYLGVPGPEQGVGDARSGGEIERDGFMNIQR